MKDINGVEVCPFCGGPLPCPYCLPPDRYVEPVDVVEEEVVEIVEEEIEEEVVTTVDDLFEELEEDDADEINEVVETNDEVEEED